MNTLEKKEGIYYTQNLENLPIEERVFFREGDFIFPSCGYYRVATAQEIEAWRQWQKEQEEKIKLE